MGLSIVDYLYIDRVDLCVYGNTLPFRIRVVNRINENFDYFYVKRADASRIYGLELEHILSPNSINFLARAEPAHAENRLFARVFTPCQRGAEANGVIHLFVHLW